MQITLKRGYNLTASFEDKIEDAGLYGWTAFVNNRGTLCHLVKAGAPFLVRLPFATRVKTASDEFIIKTIKGMVGKHLR